MLNSQPMGLYSPSQLVQDTRRHQVEVRVVDVNVSNWEAVLESSAAVPDAQFAVRLGFNIVKGLTQETCWRIEETRTVRPFADVRDLAWRARLSQRDLQALAHANALEALADHHRHALWDAVSAPDKDLLREAEITEDAVTLDAPAEGQNIAADYRVLGLTLGRHPLALLRPLLKKRNFQPASMLNAYRNGKRAYACGIVTVHQRPTTASRTIFVTIEDETGPVNVIVWPALTETYRKELLGARMLGVHEVWQCESGVRNLIAQWLVDLIII